MWQNHKPSRSLQISTLTCCLLLSDVIFTDLQHETAGPRVICLLAFLPQSPIVMVILCHCWNFGKRRGKKLPKTSNLEKSSVDIPMSSAGTTMDPFVSSSVHFTVHVWLTSVADSKNCHHRVDSSGWSLASRYVCTHLAPLRTKLSERGGHPCSNHAADGARF